MTTVVKLKSKGQMTLPAKMRQLAGIKIGDFLRVSIKANVITLSPQSLIDQRLAQSMADFEAGRSYGPFHTADEAIAFLDKQLREIKRSKSSRK